MQRHHRIFLATLILSQCCLALFAQLIPDSLGLDDNPMLTNMEARYFNIQALQTRGDFDFHGKKLGLFMENNGRKMYNKQEYFDNWAREHLLTKDFGRNQLFILTPDEKERSKGFDAFIVSWSDKKISEDRRAQLINKLRKFKRISATTKTMFE